MTPTYTDLALHHVGAIAETCAKEAQTTVEDMFSESRSRRDSAARAAFFQALHDSGRFTIRGIAEFVGRSEWTVHSAVFQSPRKRRYVKGGYPRSRVAQRVQVGRLDEGKPQIGIPQLEDLAQVPRRDLARLDGEEKGAAGSVLSRRVGG